MTSENALYNKYEALRQEKGVSTAAVCNATNLNAATFSHWKQDLYTPKVDKLLKIADYFGVPISYFYDDQGDA